MILSNKRALNRGLTTMPVVLSLSFMNAMFNLEKDFHSGEMFRVRENGGERSYHLHHLTSADIQLAIILQKICSTDGFVAYVSKKSNIYDKIEEYFEEPIGRTQFYVSYEKFLRHQLIEEHFDSVSGLTQIRLHHYIQPDGKIGAYVKGHPILFSKHFSRLTISEQKLFLTYYLHQRNEGDNHFRVFADTKSLDMQRQSVTQFLHCSPAHVKRVALRLQETHFFRSVRLEQHRGKRGFHKLWVNVNPEWYQVEDGDCHDPIEIRITYKKKANLILRWLEHFKISELAQFEHGSVFFDLVQMMKHESAPTIKYIIQLMYEKIQEQRKFSKSIITFAREELRHRTKARIMALARDCGIHRLVAPGGQDPEVREFDFASRLSQVGKRWILQLFRELSPWVQSSYMRPIRPDDLRYRFDHRLDDLNGISLVRAEAARRFKEPEAYFQLETSAAIEYLTKVKRHFERNDLDRWNNERSRFLDNLLRQVEDLPQVHLIPAVDASFRLEDVLLSKAPQVIPAL